MIRLEPMDGSDFRAFVDLAISRRAAKWVERGIWSESSAIATCRKLYAERLPKGPETPGHHFVNVVDSTTGTRVGVAWYTTETEGGKLQFWVEWIEIEPDHRRKGYASEALRLLEETAKKLGADRVGLTVWADNPGAMTLYSKLGYHPAAVNMTKSLASAPQNR